MARRRASRRRSGGDGLTIIYWRDIPAQVTATVGDDTAKVLLEPRFQHAIDRAATVAGLTETEDYVAQWRRQANPIEGEPEPAAERAAADLSADYPRPRLEALVAAGGTESDGVDDQRQDEPGGP